MGIPSPNALDPSFLSQLLNPNRSLGLLVQVPAPLMLPFLSHRSLVSHRSLRAGEKKEKPEGTTRGLRPLSLAEGTFPCLPRKQGMIQEFGFPQPLHTSLAAQSVLQPKLVVKEGKTRKSVNSSLHQTFKFWLPSLICLPCPPVRVLGSVNI